jgi:hypothetical protein
LPGFSHIHGKWLFDNGVLTPFKRCNAGFGVNIIGTVVVEDLNFEIGNQALPVRSAVA